MIFLCSVAPAFANDVAITSISLLTRDTSNAVQANHTRDIQFTLTWSNSWCLPGAACAGAVTNADANWDAVWLFAKYSVYTNGAWGNWTHCTLATSGHTSPAGSQITSASDGKGVFIYRNAAGSGPNTFANVALRWNYGADGVGDYKAVKVRVFGIEMVYIPQGSFYAGDFAATTASFRSGPSTTSPWHITGEGAINVTADGSSGYYYVAYAPPNPNESATGAVFTIAAGFPKGYNAFYMMKYELSQGQYRDFLNSLTRTQQKACIGATINVADTSVTNRYVMANNTAVQNRNGIRAPATFTANAPITFGCDLNGNDTFNEADDGEWIAMNWINTQDITAFMDWSALRPFTELELEKAARGPRTPVPSEYAWAVASYTVTAGVDANSAKTNELPATANANINVGGNPNAPLRCGIFAGVSGSVTRSLTGGSYYGVMELSGNLWERSYSVGAPNQRAFTGLHGDGALTAAGAANTSNWSLSELGYRMGTLAYGGAYNAISSRYYAAASWADRNYFYGCRGARTAP